MRRKTIFFLAGIFIVIALLVPTIVLIFFSESNIIILQNPHGQQTNGNLSISPAANENHQTTYIAVAIIMVVFFSLFGVSLYYGIKRSPKNLIST